MKKMETKFHKTVSLPAWKGGEGKIYTVDLNRRWAAAGLKELPQDY